MAFNFKQFMFDKELRQNDIAQIMNESQSVISLFVNNKRLPMRKHLDALVSHFGADTIEKYIIDDEEFREHIARQVPAMIIPAEVVESVKADVEEAESIPILSEDLSTATDLDIRAYLDELCASCSFSLTISSE